MSYYCNYISFDDAHTKKCPRPLRVCWCPAKPIILDKVMSIEMDALSKVTNSVDKAFYFACGRYFKEECFCYVRAVRIRYIITCNRCQSINVSKQFEINAFTLLFYKHQQFFFGAR